MHWFPCKFRQNGEHVFNQKEDISTLNDGYLKLVNKLKYLGSNVSSTENEISIQLAKARTAINTLSIKWKSNLSNKIKLNFSQAAVVSIPLCAFTTRMLTTRIEKRLDGNCTRVLRAILNSYFYLVLSFYYYILTRPWVDILF